MTTPRRFRVLLAGPLDRDSEARLERGAEVVRPNRGDLAELCALVRDCDALILRTNQDGPRALLEAGRRLRAVGVAGVGVDRVDVAAAAERDVAVLNTPVASADAVAEFTLTLLLHLLRPIPRLSDEYRRGRFNEARATPHGTELRDLTVGIVGMGRNGSRVGRICAAGFGARVLYNDIAPVGPFEFPAEAVEKDALWQLADVVTLHTPLTSLTRGLIGTEVVAQMRRGARLINTARGAIVRTAALLAALRSGHLAGAALDVTDPEPLPPEHPLWTEPNCILTPHVAARTHGGLSRMYAIVDRMLAFLADSPGPPSSD